MHRIPIRGLCVWLGPFVALAFCGCQLSDIFVAGEGGASDSIDETRPAPIDAGDTPSPGDDGNGTDGVQQFSIQVIVRPEGAGTISLDPPGGTYDEGTEVTFAAAPTEGFAFVSYEGDVASDSTEVVVVVDRDLSVTAQFFPLSVRVIANVEPPGAGVVTLTPPGGTYDWGTTITVDARPNTGFLFDAFVDEAGEEVAADSPHSLIAREDTVLTALFVAIEPEWFSLSVDIEPVGAGIVSLDPPGGVYESGTLVSMTATPSQGFVFEAFLDASRAIVGAQATQSIDVTEDTVFIARFAPSTTPPPDTTFVLLVEVVPTGSGTVALNPTGGSYSAGTVVTLTPSPAPGYVFARYSGDVVGISPDISVTVSRNTYVRAEFAWAPNLGNPGNLVVTGFAGDNVSEFDRFDGGLLGHVVPEGSGSLSLPAGIDFGPSGDIFVASFGSNSVLRYHGTTGAFVGEFAVVPGLFSVLTLRFGPNGNLFVPDTASDSVLEFDGNSGALLRTFVASGSGGLDNPVGLAFGPNGNLFVVSQRTNRIMEYSGTTGAFVGTFADLQTAGFTVPIDLAFNSAGDVFVTTGGNDGVERVDGVTRAVTAFIDSGVGGLDSPAGIAVHPETGNVLVVNQASDQVLEYDGTSGDFVGVFANGREGDNLFFMAFRPR